MADPQRFHAEEDGLQPKWLMPCVEEVEEVEVAMREMVRT